MRRSLFNRWCILKHLAASIRFNFHYLPFRQAIRLPVVFMSPSSFHALRGTVIIHGPIRHAMISLGLPGNDMFSRKDRILWNVEGSCTFNGSVAVNPGSSITVRPEGCLRFGNHVSLGQRTKILCGDTIELGDNVLISWDCLLMDNDGHPFYDFDHDRVFCSSSAIKVGDETFIGSHCFLLKGAVLLNNLALASSSLLNRKMEDRFALYAGIPSRLVKRNIARIIDEKNHKAGIEALKKKFASL